MEKIDAYKIFVELESVSTKAKILVSKELSLDGLTEDLGAIGQKAMALEAYLLLTKDKELIAKVKGISRVWLRQTVHYNLAQPVQISVADCTRSLHRISQMDGNTAETSSIPVELQTEEARKLLQEAIRAGLCTANYKWAKGSQLAACFVQQASDLLNLGRGTNSDGTKRIAWKPFELLFGFPSGKLRGDLNDIKKTGQSPTDVYLVDDIFKRIKSNAITHLDSRSE